VIAPFRLSPLTRQIRMHLGQHDLCQMDLDYLRSLSHEALIAVSERLLQDLKEARERLAQDPTNSSKPPSSQPAYLGLPWDGDESDRGEEADPTPPHRADNALCDEAADERPREAAGGGDQAADLQAPVPVPGKTSAEVSVRRPGKSPGAPGYGRTQVIPPRGTEVHRAETRAACGAPLLAGAPFMARQGFYVLDVEVGDAERPGLSLLLARYIITGRPNASVVTGPAVCLPSGSAPGARGARHRPP
jgi:transposase